MILLKFLAFLFITCYSVSASATAWGTYTPSPLYYFNPTAWENVSPEGMMVVFGLITMMIIIGYCVYLIFESGRKRDAEIAEMKRALEHYKNVQ